MVKLGCAVLVMLVILDGFLMALPVGAASLSFNDPGFANTWNRLDKAVGEVPDVGRGYTWGYGLNGSENLVSEPYNAVVRKVQYFDKARMEVNDPKGDPNDLFYVTTGLLVKELVTGKRQDGDDAFTQLPPSNIQVAGDPNEAGTNSVAPTYASFQKIGTFLGGENGLASTPNQIINTRINKSGYLSTFTPPDARAIAGYDEVTRHNIADVFVNFSNQVGPVWNGSGYERSAVFFNQPVYVLGRPVTEPYWIQAVVGGTEKEVLVQLFERRVLTYTPSNSAAYQVEMGNVGQHYYKWRYSKPVATEPKFFPSDFSQPLAAYSRGGAKAVGGLANQLGFALEDETTSPMAFDPTYSVAVFGTRSKESGKASLTALNLGKNPDSMGLRWTLPIASEKVSTIFATPLVYNGVVYIGENYSGKLYAVNLATGKLIWTNDSGSQTGGTLFNWMPITDGTNLYFTVNKGVGTGRRPYLYAIRLSDGAQIWSRNRNDVDLFDRPIFGFDGNLFVTSFEGRIYAYNRDGATVETWQVDPNLDVSEIAYANGLLYGLSTANNKLYSFDSTGKTIGQADIANLFGAGYKIGYPAPAIADNRIYFPIVDANATTTLVGLSTSNLKRVDFSLKLSGGTISNIAIADGILYFVVGGRKLYGVEAANSANSKILMSSVDTDETLLMSAIANGYVYLRNYNNKIYIVK